MEMNQKEKDKFRLKFKMLGVPEPPCVICEHSSGFKGIDKDDKGNFSLNCPVYIENKYHCKKWEKFCKRTRWFFENHEH